MLAIPRRSLASGPSDVRDGSGGADTDEHRVVLLRRGEPESLQQLLDLRALQIREELECRLLVPGTATTIAACSIGGWAVAGIWT